MPTIIAPMQGAPFDWQPGFYEPARLWFYGNVKLLQGRLVASREALATSYPGVSELSRIEAEVEELVLAGYTLVCGVHNYSQQRAAIVPLRYGSPRIVVFSGGFRHHLGPDLTEQPFRTARLWRYQWDPATDLAVSRRAPDKWPTFAHENPTVDRLIRELAEGRKLGLSSPLDSFVPP